MKDATLEYADQTQTQTSLTEGDSWQVTVRAQRLGRIHEHQAQHTHVISAKVVRGTIVVIRACANPETPRPCLQRAACKLIERMVDVLTGGDACLERIELMCAATWAGAEKEERQKLRDGLTWQTNVSLQVEERLRGRDRERWGTATHLVRMLLVRAVELVGAAAVPTCCDALRPIQSTVTKGSVCVSSLDKRPLRC